MNLLKNQSGVSKAKKAKVPWTTWTWPAALRLVKTQKTHCGSKKVPEYKLNKIPCLVDNVNSSPAQVEDVPGLGHPGQVGVEQLAVEEEPRKAHLKRAHNNHIIIDRWLIYCLLTIGYISTHNSPIYDEWQTQSAKVFSQPRECSGQGNFNDTLQPIFEF